MIIPDHHFVALVSVDEDNHVRFVHHFYYGDLFFEVLHLLLEPLIARIILEYLKARISSNSKILLTLVRRNRNHLGLHVGILVRLFFHKFLVAFSVFLYRIHINNSLLRAHHSSMILILRVLVFR